MGIFRMALKPEQAQDAQTGQTLPAQPWRSFHPPALSLPKQTLYPGTRRSTGKAAASEEARRYVSHFVGPFALLRDLGERKSPSSGSDFRTTLIEPLSDARTMHGKWRVLVRRGWAGEKSDFFSILLKRSDRYRSRRRTDRETQSVRTAQFIPFTNRSARVS